MSLGSKNVPIYELAKFETALDIKVGGLSISI